MENIGEKYFLGANSCEGFVSFFGESFKAGEGWRCLIIKGGPGTGKSSFMKYIAVKAADKGYKTVLCPCSSDPDSLDAVIIKDIKTVILDGTSPHVVEPKYPGACEEIINLGRFWDGEKLFSKAQEIIEVTDRNKLLHKTASRYLAACGQLFYDNLKLSRQFTDTARTVSFAKRLAEKYIPAKKTGVGCEWIRFITGITPKGVISFHKTLSENCKKLVIVDDKFGGTSDIIMRQIRNIALMRGYEIITLKSAFLPSEITEHIVIPELSLAFVTENDYITFGGKERRIHARRFADVTALHAMRSRMFFNRRVSRELLLTAAQTLSRAKTVHDELEGYYIDAMDFNQLTKFAEKTAKEIL